jgi:hypothetical protein
MYITSWTRGVLVVIEKRQGILERDRAAGVEFIHQISSTFISDSIMIVGQILVFLLIMPNFYGLRVEGSWVVFSCLLFITTIGGVYLSVMIACICSHEMEMVLFKLFLGAIFTNSSGNWNYSN